MFSNVRLFLNLRVHKSILFNNLVCLLMIRKHTSQHARAGPLRVKCGQCGLVRASQNRKGPVQVRCSFHEGKVQFSSGLSSIANCTGTVRFLYSLVSSKCQNFQVNFDVVIMCRNCAGPVQFAVQALCRF